MLPLATTASQPPPPARTAHHTDGWLLVVVRGGGVVVARRRASSWLAVAAWHARPAGRVVVGVVLARSGRCLVLLPLLLKTQEISHGCNCKQKQARRRKEEAGGSSRGGVKQYIVIAIYSIDNSYNTTIYCVLILSHA